MDSIFNLRGPSFLVFYTGLGIAVNLLLRFLISRQEKNKALFRQDMTDPYKIACLRAGHLETLRLVIFSLIDRGLLKASGDLITSEKNARDMVRRPVEKAAAAFFTMPREAKEIFKDSITVKAAEDYNHALVCEGLLSDLKVYLARTPAALAATFLLVWVSITKLDIALSRGHHNVIFLLILTLILLSWTVSIWKKKRTGAGELVLKEIKLRFLALKGRANALRPGGTTNDSSYLAAVYGMAALPAVYFPYIKTLFPKASSSSGGDSGGCGGGGCGSSGCGGGGCGGGCGGCGG